MFRVFQWISQFYTINPLIYFNILSAAQDHIRTNIYNMYVCVCVYNPHMHAHTCTHTHIHTHTHIVCVCVRERDGEESQNVNGDTTVFSILV